MRKAFTILLIIAVTSPGLAGHGSYARHGLETDLSPENGSSVPVLSSFPSELTVDGLVSLANGNFAIQMGAFIRRSYAEGFSKKISEMTGLTLDLVEEDGMYKVFINSSLRGESPCLYIPSSFQGYTKNGGTSTRKPRTAPKPASSTGTSVTAAPGSSAMKRDTVPAGVQTEVNPDTTAVVSAEGEMQAPDAGTNGSQDEPAVDQPLQRNIRNLFFLKGDSPWLTRYNYFGKSVALVNALIFTILGSFASMLMLLLVILLNRRRMEREATLRQYLLEQYQSLIIDYLFGGSDSVPFRKIASDDYRRQVLIDQMIDVSVNLKGDSREKLTKLYIDLELDSDSLARAKSRRWHKKIKGFRELAFMGIKEGNEEMVKVLNSRNEILRMEAQIALVRLSDSDHFEFLSHLKRPFSLWEQITLHDLIIQHDMPVPEFKTWLSSENPTVVMFSLRMIREFRQAEAEPELRKVMLHRDPRVSRLAIEVAGDLNMRSTLETMKRMYKFQEYNNCLEIVRSIGKMPEASMLGFLKLVLDKEDDVQLQIEAVKAIENMGETGVQALVKVMKSEYKNYNIIVRHVLDRRIY
jgi:hypothetical protein